MGNSISHGGFAQELHRLGDYDQATAQLLHRKYLELDLEFGIDSTDLTKLLKAAEIEVSDGLVKSIMNSFPNKEILNVLDFLEGFCFLCKGDPEAKLSGFFDVFDFQSRGEISFDELTIMLMSVARGIKFLQGKAANEADDDKVAGMLRDDLDQQQGMEADISKQQYLIWAKEKAPPFDASIDDFVDFCTGHPYKPDQNRDVSRNAAEVKQDKSISEAPVEEKRVTEATSEERKAEVDESILAIEETKVARKDEEPQPQEDSQVITDDKAPIESSTKTPTTDSSAVKEIKVTEEDYPEKQCNSETVEPNNGEDVADAQITVPTDADTAAKANPEATVGNTDSPMEQDESAANTENEKLVEAENEKETQKGERDSEQVGDEPGHAKSQENGEIASPNASSGDAKPNERQSSTPERLDGSTEDTNPQTSTNNDAFDADVTESSENDAEKEPTSAIVEKLNGAAIREQANEGESTEAGESQLTSSGSTEEQENDSAVIPVPDPERLNLVEGKSENASAGEGVTVRCEADAQA